MKVDIKVRNYLFIAYEMYVQGKTKEWLDKDLYGIELLFEMDEFKQWLRKEGINLDELSWKSS